MGDVEHSRRQARNPSRHNAGPPLADQLLALLLDQIGDRFPILGLQQMACASDDVWLEGRSWSPNVLLLFCCTPYTVIYVGTYSYPYGYISRSGSSGTGARTANADCALGSQAGSRSTSGDRLRGS